MTFESYMDGLLAVLERIRQEQSGKIKEAGKLVGAALAAGGVIHTFGTGHAHLIADEAFYRAGGIAAINPILDERLIFLKGALESTRAEREHGLAAALLEREDLKAEDAAIIISNSGRNAVPIEMALEMKARGIKVIAITNLEQSRSSSALHVSGKRLYELADVAIDNCVPAGDALLSVPGTKSKIGPASTVAGAAIINSIIIEAVASLLHQGKHVPVLPSANVASTSEKELRDILAPYGGRIRYLDLDEVNEANHGG